MSEPDWPDPRALLDLHSEQLQAHGGSAGLRDENGFMSALARPRTILGYEPDADFFRLAAAYGYGLTRNHPFVDGNKRMAWIATFVFLRMNGWYLDAAEHEAAEVMVALSNGALDEQGFADWLKDQAIAA